MAWDTTKNSGDVISSADYNAMVTDQKGHKTRHATGGTDALLQADLPTHASRHVGGGNDVVAGFTSQNVVTGSRVVGTVYQNTSGKSMLVCFSGTSTSATAITAISDSAASPTTTVQVTGNQAGTTITLIFIVLNNYYYKVTVGAGTPSIQCWTEYT